MRSAFVYEMVHNLARYDELQIFSYGAVARSRHGSPASTGPCDFMSRGERCRDNLCEATSQRPRCRRGPCRGSWQGGCHLDVGRRHRHRHASASERRGTAGLRGGGFCDTGEPMRRFWPPLPGARTATASASQFRSVRRSPRCDPDCAAEYACCETNDGPLKYFTSTVARRTAWIAAVFD